MAARRRLSVYGADITRSFPSRGAAMAVHRSTHTGCAGVQQAACAAGYRYVKGCVEENFTARSC